MFFKLVSMLKKDIEMKRLYFVNAEKEIAEKNLGLLRLLSFITCVLLLFFYSITPFIIPGWKISPQHLLFFPVVLLYFILAHFYAKKGSQNVRFITLICLLFVLILFAFTLAIDVFSAPWAPSSFIPLLIIAFPVLFIFRFREIFSAMLFVEIIYVILVKKLKDSAIAEYDVFNSVVAFMFALAVAHIILKLRSEDHDIRSRYKKLSMLDALTGILNKASCENAIIQYLNTRSEHYFALLFIDLDDFKKVNDTAGHYAGDQLLSETGKILFNFFRTSGITGRIGGDEFMVMLKDFHDSEESLRKKCMSLQSALGQTVATHSLDSTCSIGAILVSNYHTDFQTAYKLADKSLYEAKTSGKNRCVIHTLTSS